MCCVSPFWCLIRLRQAETRKTRGTMLTLTDHGTQDTPFLLVQDLYIVRFPIRCLTPIR